MCRVKNSAVSVAVQPILNLRLHEYSPGSKSCRLNGRKGKLVASGVVAYLIGDRHKKEKKNEYSQCIHIACRVFLPYFFILHVQSCALHSECE